MSLITKSIFMQGHQCQKLLWLALNIRDALVEASSAQTEDGEEVGALARGYFGQDYTLIELSKPEDMVHATRAALAAGTQTICEASFATDDLFCAADIVRPTPSGLEVYEVKSSTSPKPEQYDDMAFQYHVIEAAGFTISKFSIIYVNGLYEFEGDIDLHGLFTVQDCTADLKLRQLGIAHTIGVCRHVRDMSTEPSCALSYHCEKPYLCPAKEYCFNLHQVPEHSVFDIAGMPAKKKYELYAQGYVTPQQLQASTILTDRQYTQVSGMGKPFSSEVSINKSALRDYLEALKYPIYFLDFETIMHAVPRYRQTTPFAQVPFQYSLHVQDRPFAKPEHMEFLARAGEDPRRDLAQQLCSDISQNYTCMAYNDRFEKGVNKKLAELFPDISHQLLSINARMCDLMVPFQQRWWYSDQLGGSYSIKAVLPAMCPNDPELDYLSLPGPHNGVEAMATFASLAQTTDPAEAEHMRSGLLKYCGLDTLAMVKILDALWACL